MLLGHFNRWFNRRYKMHLSGYTGDATNSFLISDTRHNINDMPFSAFDNDHSTNPSHNCASAGTQHGGG